MNEQKISYDFGTTISDKKIMIKNAEKEVNSILELFANYSLVICDRLHAMIFSYLAETPCIAFDNLSKKVSGVYYWIRDVENINCITDNNFELSLISKLIGKEVFKINFEEEFEELFNKI